MSQFATPGDEFQRSTFFGYIVNGDGLLDKAAASVDVLSPGFSISAMFAVLMPRKCHVVAGYFEVGLVD